MTTPSPAQTSPQVVDNPAYVEKPKSSPSSSSGAPEAAAGKVTTETKTISAVQPLSKSPPLAAAVVGRAARARGRAASAAAAAADDDDRDDDLDYNNRNGTQSDSDVHNYPDSDDPDVLDIDVQTELRHDGIPNEARGAWTLALQELEAAVALRTGALHLFLDLEKRLSRVLTTFGVRALLSPPLRASLAFEENPRFISLSPELHSACETWDIPHCVLVFCRLDKVPKQQARLVRAASATGVSFPVFLRLLLLSIRSRRAGEGKLPGVNRKSEKVLPFDLKRALAWMEAMVPKTVISKGKQAAPPVDAMRTTPDSKPPHSQKPSVRPPRCEATPPASTGSDGTEGDPVVSLETIPEADKNPTGVSPLFQPNSWRNVTTRRGSRASSAQPSQNALPHPDNDLGDYNMWTDTGGPSNADDDHNTDASASDEESVDGSFLYRRQQRPRSSKGASEEPELGREVQSRCLSNFASSINSISAFDIKSDAIGTAPDPPAAFRAALPSSPSALVADTTNDNDVNGGAADAIGNGFNVGVDGDNDSNVEVQLVANRDLDHDDHDDARVIIVVNCDHDNHDDHDDHEGSEERPAKRSRDIPAAAEHLENINGTSWLRGEVVNACVGAILDSCKPLWVAVDSLAHKDMGQAPQPRLAHELAMSTDKIVLPLLLAGNHWALALVLPGTDAAQAWLYDSLPSREHASEAEDRVRRLLTSHFSLSPTQGFLQEMACPTQPNGFDCGVHVIRNLVYLAADQPIPTIANARLWRALIAVMCHCMGMPGAQETGASRPRLQGYFRELYLDSEDLVPDVIPAPPLPATATTTQRGADSYLAAVKEWHQRAQRFFELNREKLLFWNAAMQNVRQARQAFAQLQVGGRANVESAVAERDRLELCVHRYQPSVRWGNEKIMQDLEGVQRQLSTVRSKVTKRELCCSLWDVLVDLLDEAEMALQSRIRSVEGDDTGRP